MPIEITYKIIVIGDPSVGKTSLLNNFTSEKFKETYLPTIGVNMVKDYINLEMDGKAIKFNLVLWDIAGQPTFTRVHKAYFKGSDGMMLVFDFTRPKTLSNIKNWDDTATRFGLRDIPRILIGNKNDMAAKKPVNPPTAIQLSKTIQAPYFETSAKTNKNVPQSFRTLAEDVTKKAQQS